mmetsp:Transcript_32886/g.49627  ORF Transcript_32886/g.49627 Transcript_32886/m.49627 type:complete len:222 (+) Transcript_32886:70-735(+)
MTPVSLCSMIVVLLVTVCFPNTAQAFLHSPTSVVVPKTTAFFQVVATRATTTTRLNLFEDDDVSAFNALCQFGPSPFFIRITQSDKYWEAVNKFQKEERVSRVIAVRNMDAYFADPMGWALKRERAKDYGEVIDYTKKTGVQKRPVFSLFMLCLTTWFFLSFLPTRVNELGGLKPSALEGGFCPPDVRIIDENGKERFECKPKTFSDQVVANEKELLQQKK